MSLSYINLDKINNEPRLSLCKPDLARTKIGNLTDVYDVELTINLGALNELSFNIPIYIERNHQLVKNPLIDKFEGLYQVRVEWNKTTEYFVYTKGNRKLSESGSEYSYRLISIGHLLSKKYVAIYEEQFKTLSHFARDFIEGSNDMVDTGWKVDTVDVSFDIRPDNHPNIKSFSAENTNVLNALFELANKFGALIKWDTVNKKISFIKPESSGVDKGFRVREGVFLESLDAEINYDEVITRLYVYGQDGLEFRRLSPSGVNYIESYEWFMYPFECDANYNVLKSSKYLSDGLCVAIRKYEKLLEEETPKFKTLTYQLTDKESEITIAEQDLKVLKADLNRIHNELDLINATYMDEAKYRKDRQDASDAEDAKLIEIKNKEYQIETLKDQKVKIQGSITTLKDNLSRAKNFTYEQSKELENFTFSKPYTNDAISDEEDLLMEGIKVFKQYHVPPTQLNISLVNFLKDFEFEKIKNRISIGDIVYAKLKDFDLDLSMKITQIRYNFESESFNLTVSNLMDLRDDWQKFLETIQSASNVSAIVDLHKNVWDGITDANDLISQILNSEYDTAKNILTGGTESTIEIGNRGIFNRDPYDPNTWMVINAGILAITDDAGKTVQVSISKNGVHAERIVGRLMLTQKMWIEDEQGIVTIQSGIATFYDETGVPRVYIGKYPSFENPSQYKVGLRVDNGSFELRTSTSAQSGLLLDGTGISTYNNNKVRTFHVDAVTGKVSIVGSLDIRTSPDSNRGVVISGDGIRIYNTYGGVAFYADNYGNVYYTGRLIKAYGDVDDLTGTIKDMDGNFVGRLDDATGTFDGKLTSKSMKTLELEAEQITSGKIKAELINTQSLTAATIDVKQLRADNAQVTNLSAISSNLGNITGGNIDISESISIGQSVYLRGYGTGVYFDSWSQIFDGGGNLTVEAFNILHLVGGAGRIEMWGDVHIHGTLTGG